MKCQKYNLTTDFTKIQSRKIDLNNDNSKSIIVYNMKDYIKYLENNNLIYDSELINPEFSEVVSSVKEYLINKKKITAIKFKILQIPVRQLKYLILHDNYYFEFEIYHEIQTYVQIILNLKINTSVIYDIKKDKYIDTLLFLNNENEYKKYYAQSFLKQEQIITIKECNGRDREGINKYSYGNINDNTMLLDMSVNSSYHLGIVRQGDSILQYLLNNGLDFDKKYRLCISYDAIVLSDREQANIFDNNIFFYKCRQDEIHFTL